jgi:hypothetical protein
MSRSGRCLLVMALAAAVASAATAAPAAASFHLISIREVYPGSTAASDAEYVELQMYAAGQNLVQGHTLNFFAASGAPSGSATFAANVPNSANQSTVVAATPTAESQFGLGADTGMPAGALDPAGGAVCWEAIDCVSWGTFAGATPSPAGSPADPLGIPDGMALRRTIEPGCPTLLEASDDSDSSAADFFDALPAPRPNSAPPSEHACASPGLGAGSGGGAGEGAGAGRGGGNGRRPQTRIRRGPPRLSRRRTATFRFVASVPRSTFLCKLDRRPFRPCRSPDSARHLRPGRHVFRVKARAPGGATDRTPALWRFRVIASG